MRKYQTNPNRETFDQKSLIHTLWKSKFHGTKEKIEELKRTKK